MASLALDAHQFRPALGTVCDVLYRHRPSHALLHIHADHLRYYLATFLYQQVVTLAYTHLGYKVGVDQRRPPHRRAAQPHGRQVGHRRNNTRAPHLVADALQRRAHTLGLELVGYSPSRRLGRQAQFVPQSRLVNLDDDAVDAVRQLPACLVPMVDEGLDLVYILAFLDVGLHLEAHLPGPFQAPVVCRLEFHPVRGHHEIHAEHQFALGTLGRILQLERTAGGIAWIGERLKAVGLALAVHGLKGVERVHHLAPRLEVVGEVAVQAQRYGGYGLGVGRYVVAHTAVAACHCLHQLPVAVGEAYGHTVVLQLAGVAELLAVEQLAGTRLKLLYLLYAVGIAQREHRQPVRHLAETFVHLAAHALGRRQGRGQLRVLPLEVLELAHHAVKLLVAHQRPVVHIILVVEPVEFRRQLFHVLAHRLCVYCAEKVHVPSKFSDTGPVR